MGHGYEGTPVQIQFEAAMERRGLVPPKNLIADGGIQRCNTKAKNGRGDGSYLLHLDGAIPAGGFQNFQDGLEWENWSFDPGRKLTNSEREEIKSKAEAAEKACKQAKARDKAKAAEKARRLWDSAADVVQPHAYLAGKGIMPHGVRLKYGSLVVPISDALGALTSLQFIRPDGSKTFLRGGRVKGCFYRIGGDEGRIVIVEGLATAASVHEATGCTVVVAFYAGNLKAVAEAVRKQWPDADIVVGADDDRKTKGNPGLTKATEAARAISAKLAVPNFGVNRRDRDTDFNDLGAFIGTAAVRRCIDAAAVPEPAPEDIDPNVEIERLRKLDAVAYERERSEAAKRLGIRVSKLDDQVRARRADDDGPKAGRAIAVEDIEPWAEPVDGDEVLHEIARALRDHISITAEQADTVALYCVYTHAYALWRIAPRLGIRAPGSGCGKSELLRRIKRLVPRPVSCESLTAPVLFRLIDGFKPALLLDELDNMLPDDKSAMLGILNSGYERDGKAFRCVGDQNELRAFSTFAPVIYAMIGAPPGTFDSRTTAIEMRRATPAEARGLLSMENGEPEDERFQMLGRKAARWVLDNRDRLAQARPAMSGLVNRAADNWKPLFAVAAVAGGDWPARAQRAARALADAAGAQSAFEETLAVIKALLGECDEIGSKDIVEHLAKIEDGPWAEWGRDRKPITQNALARLLKPHRVRPTDIGPVDARRKGYRRTDLQPLFEAYLKSTADTPSSQPRSRAECDGIRVSEHFLPRSENLGCADANAEKLNENNALRGYAVADEGWPQESTPDAAGTGANAADRAAAGEPGAVPPGGEVAL
jgi:putative DNA primase/helicase